MLQKHLACLWWEEKANYQLQYDISSKHKTLANKCTKVAVSIGTATQNNALLQE